MNVYTEATDPLGEKILPRMTGSFYSRYDGYRVSWLSFKGSITTIEEAQQMIDFFQVMKQNLKV